MAKINDLSQGNLGEVWAAIRKLQYSTSQNNSAIGRGGLTVYGGGGITIENGGLVVTGSATISGLLEASGTINMTGTFTATGDVNLNGPTDVAGDFTVTGPTNLNGVTAIAGDTTVTGDFTVTGPTALNGTTTVAGDTTVTGIFTVNGAMKTTSTLSVEGVTTLKNDLNVTSGGKINFGDMTIDPSLFGGSIQFDGGGYLSGTASGPQITGPAGNSFVYTRNGLAGIQAADIDLTGSVRVLGALKITSPGTETGVTPNVYLDASGNLRKII